ncbi:MAG TPA: maleylacetoacetate isomerase [Kofleriaceae bacterium]
MTAIRLHNWHSSSTSFRVRIGLNLKGLAYENVPVELRWKDSDHETDAFRALNPQTNVPVLEVGNEQLQQSLAILEYLDRIQPAPPLVPADALGRARAWSIALHVACEIQSLNNLRVQRYLINELKLPDTVLSPWQLHWITVGFDAIEQQLASSSYTGTYCHGNTPTIADCCLVPQVYNARRPVVGADMARWPTIARIYDTCMQHPAFDAAQPKNQPGFESPALH